MPQLSCSCELPLTSHLSRQKAWEANFRSSTRETPVQSYRTITIPRPTGQSLSHVLQDNHYPTSYRTITIPHPTGQSPSHACVLLNSSNQKWPAQTWHLRDEFPQRCSRPSKLRLGDILQRLTPPPALDDRHGNIPRGH